MHEDVFRADDGYGSATQEPLPLPLDFEAHYVMSQEARHSYALYRLGANDVAERAVHRAVRGSRGEPGRAVSSAHRTSPCSAIPPGRPARLTTAASGAHWPTLFSRGRHDRLTED